VAYKYNYEKVPHTEGPLSRSWTQKPYRSRVSSNWWCDGANSMDATFLFLL